MNKEIIDGICIITPDIKHIDVTNAGNFGNMLDEYLDSDSNFILDLQNVSFMDSSGLGKIITGLRKVHDKQKTMVICNVSEAVKVLFDLVRLSQISTICVTREDAIKEVGN